MAPVELKELKLQWQELLEKEFIRPSVSVKVGKFLIFQKNGKNSKLIEMVQGCLKNFLDLG